MAGRYLCTVKSVRMIKFCLHVYKLMVRKQQPSRAGLSAEIQSGCWTETRARKALGTRAKNRGNLGSYGRSSRARGLEIREHLGGQTHLRSLLVCTHKNATCSSLFYNPRTIRCTNKAPTNAHTDSAALMVKATN